MYEWYIRFGLFILLIILLVIIIVFVLNRNTNKNTTRGVKYKNLNMVEKLTKKLLRGEIDMNELSKNFTKEPAVNSKLSTALFQYVQQKQLESSLGAIEFSRCATIVEASLLEFKSFEDNHTIVCMDLLKKTAELFSVEEKTLLSSKLIESPLVFLEEMQKMVESKGEDKLLVSDTINQIVDNISELNITPPKITDESAKKSDESDGLNNDQAKASGKDVNDTGSSGDNESDEKVELTQHQIEVNENREDDDVKAEVNFRQLLPIFGNGIDSAIASCRFKAFDTGKSGLKSTSKWELSDLDANDFNTLIVAFRQKKSDTTKPYLEVYDYLIKMSNLQAQSKIN